MIGRSCCRVSELTLQFGSAQFYMCAVYALASLLASVCIACVFWSIPIRKQPAGQAAAQNETCASLSTNAADSTNVASAVDF